MHFSLDQRTASLSVGELADFVIGPRDAGDGASGLWRAQLGTHWHQQWRARAQEIAPSTLFEVPLSGQIAHRGWTLTLTGRIDQLEPEATLTVLREIKTVMRALPADESELRREYPSYFAQLGIYLSLLRSTASASLPFPGAPLRGELVFVEADSGLSQTVVLTAEDETVLRNRLEGVAEFLELRWRARERLRRLRFRSPFPVLRPGQEAVQADLRAAYARQRIVFFEAPTGFGKTGALLEFALGRLQAGDAERIIYLTSKSTGQLQVARTLSTMTENVAPQENDGDTGVAVWQVRNKREHCINAVFQCVPDACRHLVDLETRWPRSGLSRLYLLHQEARDIQSLRLAGQAASICPYEITRTALAFNDVWIGDYNYVFSPGTRGLFAEQAGYDPARTLLIVDEAHNLPSRVADAYSRVFAASDAFLVREALHRTRPPAQLVKAWSHWTDYLQHVKPTEALSLADEDDARDLLQNLAGLITTTPLDPTTLGPGVMELIWDVPSFATILGEADLPRLWWCARPGELSATCLDAASAIGPTLRRFAGVMLASATLRPAADFAAACGLDLLEDLPAPAPAPAPARLGALNKRETRKLYARISTASDLLKVEESREAAEPAFVVASAPWRVGAYDVAIDARVDTSYQQRERHLVTTAATIEAFRRMPDSGYGRTQPLAAFFPSYSYAEAVERALAERGMGLKVALQPRQSDLAAQTAWVEASLGAADTLFLVLGSSFAEGIDLLGGRVGEALVVGPALPEVNAVQRARLANVSHLGRDASFRRVYQVPGIQKVNQGLGRLVRAPGQRAKVLLHCRRFAEPGYANLLAPEYRSGKRIASDADLAEWLAK